MLEKKLLLELQEYVDRKQNSLVFSMSESVTKRMADEIHSIELENFIKSKRTPSFHKVLFSYIDRNE